jgi:hypothetical protein
MGNWRALLLGLVLGAALGLWVLSRVESGPPAAAPLDAGAPAAGDAGAAWQDEVPRAYWALPALDLRTGPLLSEALLYPVCGSAVALSAPGDLDAGQVLELGPVGGCSGAVVTASMHPVMLELLSLRSGLVETAQGWLPTTEVPFVSRLVLTRAARTDAVPLPLVNPRVLFHWVQGRELLLIDDDGACGAEASEARGELDGGPALHPRPLPSGRFLRVQLPPDVLGLGLAGGWRQSCADELPGSAP